MSNEIGGTIISLICPVAESGKTSAAVKLAEILSNKNKKVLLIDADPKSGLSDYVATSEYQSKTKGLYDLLIERNNLEDVIAPSRLQIPFVPSGTLLSKIEEDITMVETFRNSFKSKLVDARGSYDVIIIDTPSRFGPLSSLGMMVCDYYIVPIKTKSDSNVVISELEKIHQVLERTFGCGKLKCLFHSMAVPEDKYTKFIIRQIELAHKVKTLSTIIPLTPFGQRRHEYYESLLEELSDHIPELNSGRRG